MEQTDGAPNKRFQQTGLTYAFAPARPAAEPRRKGLKDLLTKTYK